VIGLWVPFLLIFSGCAHNPESFYFGDYSEAEKLYNRGEYQKAIDKYQAYLKDHPEGHLAVIAQYYIGKSYLELNEPDTARTIFEGIMTAHPDVVWAKFSETQIQEMQKPKSSGAE
jgi:TolA-binding protein